MTIKPDAIQQAYQRIAPHITKTPILTNPFLDKRLNAKVFIKAECLQQAGAFKYRGAFNRLSQLTEQEKKRGVVAFSSGNHAQGVALAANTLGIPATIVMPSDAPAVKLQRTRDYGAEVRLYKRQRASREAIADEIAQTTGAIVVPSFDDPHIIAGQGTCGLEIVEHCLQAHISPQTLLSPCGGGGLIAGVSVAVKQQWPNLKVYGVEPEGFDDHRRSLQSGKRERNNPQQTSLCDALLAPSPGELTWAINHQQLSGALVVTDEEVKRAISFAWSHLKLVVEPGGAVALAALLAGKMDVSGQCVVIILSGGNIDEAVFSQCLSEYGHCD